MQKKINSSLLSIYHELDVNILILQMRKLRFREDKMLVSPMTSKQVIVLDFKPDPPNLKLPLYHTGLELVVEKKSGRRRILRMKRIETSQVKV